MNNKEKYRLKFSEALQSEKLKLTSQRVAIFDEVIYGEKPMKTKASKIIKNLLPYTEKYLNENGSSWGMCRHLLKLIEGFKGAKSMREEISIISQQKKSDISFLKKIAQQLEDAGH